MGRKTASKKSKQRELEAPSSKALKRAAKVAKPRKLGKAAKTAPIVAQKAPTTAVSKPPPRAPRVVGATPKRTTRPKAALKAAPRVASKAAPRPAPKPAPVAETPAPEAPKPAQAAAAAPAPERELSAAEILNLLSPSQRETVEAMSVNLARAALTAQGVFAEAALRQADRPAALSPDPFHVAPALSQVMGKLASQPDRMMRAQADLFSHYLELWRSTTQRMVGEEPEPVVRPAKGDKRFADKDWSANPMFDVIKQSYLLTSNWLNGLVSDVEDVEPMTKRRVEFFTKMLTDAFSPSNFLISNPEALREAFASRGESLVRGMDNLAHDLERGNGQLSISQTDFTPFKVGENIAASPGKVVFQNELIQLLQYEPLTEQAHEIPLLIFPPWINKFYILDLQPANSMIRWLSSQGFTVFVASWVNPDAQLASKTFEDYMLEGAFAAVDAVVRQCGVSKVNTVGYCVGGTLLGCTLAYMAAKGDERIASATFFATQQDFTEAGDLLLFTDEAWINQVEKQMEAGGGVLPGQAMADTFNTLRANDLIWSFFVNNYLLGKEPKAFDLLYWNSDQTRMPKTLHLWYLRQFYRDNKLAKGELEIGGVRLDLSKITIPVYVQASKEDHIAPARSVYKGARLYGGPVTFTMAGSGHIAGVINAPAAHKYQHWTNSQLPETLDAWSADAVEHPGSWWTHWGQWLADKSGPMIPARDPSMGPLTPIEDAPGSFVKVRS